MPDETRSKVDTVRAMFDSYQQQNRESAERLLADRFVFTSPQDDHIDRNAYFERCFPTANRFVRQDLLHVAQADGDDVFVMYEYELQTGELHRNVEVLTVNDGQITEVQVFFGGRYR
jgi:ketosteroid isomerase-like protein